MSWKPIKMEDKLLENSNLERKTFLFPEEIAFDMLDFKIPLATIILTFVLFAGGTTFESADLAYGQFFDNSETNGNTTSSNSTSNFATSEESNAAEIVLLSQN